MATNVEGRYNYTATGILGEKRNTMLRNELHLRNKVGHVGARGFELPSRGFIYGLPYEKKDLTAAHALHGWAGMYLPKSVSAKTKYSRETDFVKLNKAALAGGLVRASENSDYKIIHDIHRSPFDNNEKLRTRRLPPTTVFGIPSRPSTPIFDLLEYKYQDEWIKERHNQLNAKRSAEMKRRVMSAPVGSRSHGIIYETRASLLRAYQNPVDCAPLWQMPRFAKCAKPHIQTFRTDAAKAEAFQNLEIDKNGRQGDF